MELFVVENPKIDELDDDSEDSSYKIVCAESAEHAAIEASWPGAKVHPLTLTAKRSVLYEL